MKNRLEEIQHELFFAVRDIYYSSLFLYVLFTTLKRALICFSIRKTIKSALKNN